LIKKIISFFFRKEHGSFTDFDLDKKEKISKKINKLIGSFPNELDYFIKAFTHRSYLEKTNGNIKSNERLEFLGDSILGHVTAEYLFFKFPNENEGFLTKARSQIVNKYSLERIGSNLDLQNLIFLNENYLHQDKMKLGNIIADSLEALIAAIYLDKGEETVKKFIIEYIINPQIGTGEIHIDSNFKGQLLEYSHTNKLEQPVYKVLEQSGPQHDKTYRIQVSIGENITGIGVGPNKKSAEQEAAKKALSMVENQT